MRDAQSPPPLLPLLRSRLQAELLTLVLLTPGREWTLTELAGRVGASVSSAQREAARAEQAGVIVSRRPLVPILAEQENKSAASLLTAQGLRATSRGGHLAVQEAVIAQFGSTVRVFRAFSRIRRARNSFEYPSTSTPGPATDAITVATQARDAAITILDQGILTTW